MKWIFLRMSSLFGKFLSFSRCFRKMTKCCKILVDTYLLVTHIFLTVFCFLEELLHNFNSLKQ